MDATFQSMSATTEYTWGIAKPTLSEAEECELDALDAMEKAWLLTIPPQNTIRQLMDLYPDAKTAAMRATRARIKDIQKQISDLAEVRDQWNHAINKMSVRQRPAYLDWLEGHIERLREVLEDDLSKYEKDLRFLKYMGKEKDESPMTDKGVSEMQVARAKDTRISDIIKVSRGHKANCLWHDDENPSMHVYGTRVHCFVCGNHGDAIDVYMKVYSTDFISAVKALAV